MAFTYSFFNSVSGDRTYNAADWAAYFSTFIGNGIFQTPTAQLQVVPLSGRTVRVNAGKVFINGYYGNNVTNETLDLTGLMPTSNSVIVRIVVGLDLIGRMISVYPKVGNQSSNPTAPALTRNANIYELALADIRLNSNTTNIPAASITDRRPNSSLCGWVSGTVSQINTTGLFQQFTDSFETWFATIQGQLDGDIAGNLQNQINDLNANKASTATVSLVSNGLMSASNLARLNANTGKILQLEAYINEFDDLIHDPILLNGVNPYNTTTLVPQVRKTGRIVEFDGALTNIYANDTLCFQLPNELRPRKTKTFILTTTTSGGKARYYRMTVSTNGNVTFNNTVDGINNIVSNTFFELSGISYIV